MIDRRITFIDMKIILIDLDWTLAELKPDSDRNNHTGDEKPIEQMVYLVQQLMHTDLNVIVMTGRKDKYFSITVQWLISQWIPVEVIMQTKGRADKNHVFKKEQMIEIQKNHEIIALVDDNPLMIPVCKDLGILLLTVNR